MRQFTEGVDAHLRTLRFRVFSLVNEARQEAENIHLAGLCDDAEDAAILLALRPPLPHRPQQLARG